MSPDVSRPVNNLRRDAEDVYSEDDVCYSEDVARIHLHPDTQMTRVSCSLAMRMESFSLKL